MGEGRGLNVSDHHLGSKGRRWVSLPLWEIFEYLRVLRSNLMQQIVQILWKVTANFLPFFSPEGTNKGVSSLNCGGGGGEGTLLTMRALVPSASPLPVPTY